MLVRRFNTRSLFGVGVRPTDEFLVRALAFDARGERLAIGAGPHVAVFGLADGGRVASYHVPSENLLCEELGFSCDGRHLLVKLGALGYDCVPKALLVFAEGQPTPRLRIEPPEGPSAFSTRIGPWTFSPDGAALLVVATNGTHVWGLPSARPMADVDALLQRLMRGADDGMPRTTFGGIFRALAPSSHIALGPGGGSLAVWANAPYDPRYLEYFDQIAVGDTRSGEHRVVELRDPAWFTTQVDRNGRHLLAFSEDGSVLVGAMPVNRSGARFVASFLHDLRAGRTEVCSTPVDSPLDPYAIDTARLAVVWSDAHDARKTITVVRQRLACRDHEVTTSPSEGGKSVTAVTASADGALIAKAVGDDVFVLRPT
jgi:hypothetical protein